MIIAAVKVDKTLSELAEQFDVHPNQVRQWKAQLLEQAAMVFATAAERKEQLPGLKTLHTKIGQLTPDNNFYPARSLIKQPINESPP